VGTPGQPGKKIDPNGRRAEAGTLGVSAAYLLHTVEKIPGNDRFMEPGIKISTVLDQTKIELVLEQLADGVLGPRTVSAGAEARLVEKLSDSPVGVLAGGVEFVGTADDLSLFGHDLPDTIWTLDVTERQLVVMEPLADPGDLSLPHLASEVLHIPVGKDGENVKMETPLRRREVEVLCSKGHHHIHRLEFLEVNEDVVEVAGETV
jgi:hypothetical protein